MTAREFCKVRKEPSSAAGATGYRDPMVGRLARIAARAGVSEATVSRVLNDKPGIALRTRREVVAAMDLLGIERPTALQVRDVGLVGIIVPELDNPIHPRLVQAIVSGLARRRYTPIVGQQGVGDVHENDFVHALLAHSVRGLVIVSGINAIEGIRPERYQQLAELSVPFVFVNGGVRGLAVPSYSMDDAASVDLAVSHLAGLGHTRIGLAIGESLYQPVVRRSAAFRVAMRRFVDADLTDNGLDSLIEHTGYSIAGGGTAATALLDRGVTGVVCGSDLMAVGVIAAAHARGLRVPEDVSVVGSDDSNLIPYLSPPLTTVRQPADAIGAAAADALMNRMVGGEAESGEHMFPPELMVRASTSAPASSLSAG